MSGAVSPASSAVSSIVFDAASICRVVIFPKRLILWLMNAFKSRRLMAFIFFKFVRRPDDGRLSHGAWESLGRRLLSFGGGVGQHIATVVVCIVGMTSDPFPGDLALADGVVH